MKIVARCVRWPFLLGMEYSVGLADRLFCLPNQQGPKRRDRPKGAAMEDRGWGLWVYDPHAELVAGVSPDSRLRVYDAVSSGSALSRGV
jgi:hypothetical protein